MAAADAVGRHGAHDLGAEQVRLGRLARAGGAGRGDDHRLGLGEAVHVRREEGERHGGGVAAGHRDAPGPLQRGARAGQFGQAVGPGPGVRGAVELLPVRGVPQPEVGARVDDQHLVAELLGDGGGPAVRQGEEHDVVPGEHLGGGRLQDPPGEREEVRLERAERLPGVGVAGQRADPGAGVREQQPQQLPARVPARSRHCHSYRHGPSSWMA